MILFHLSIRWVDVYGVRRDRELKIEYKFDNPEIFQLFGTHSEKDYNMGYSTCEFVPTDNNTGLFRGYLNTQIPKVSLLCLVILYWPLQSITFRL